MATSQYTCSFAHFLAKLISMKVMSWNINSIQARLERLVSILERYSPDIVCIQELKVPTERFPFLDLEKLGYFSAVKGQKTYNGVAILSKTKPNQVFDDFDDGQQEPQARVIRASFDFGDVVCTYVPNGGEVGSERYAYKLAFIERLVPYLQGVIENAQDALVCGDFNMAPEARDCHDPQAWEGTVIFNDDMRKAMQRIFSLGLIDTFRLHHQGDGLFSWWDYRAGAFPKNQGLRIDFILCTKGLSKRSTGAIILRTERKGQKPSDHAPILTFFDEPPFATGPLV